MISKKLNNPKVLLTLVALLVIFMVGVGITYSWIEGGTTYSIQTEHSDDVKTGELDGSLDNKVFLISADNTKGTTNLVLHDKTTSDFQDLIFTPVSSADGRNFFLPTAYGENGKPVTYRAATTNDIGTKFISFTFDVEAAEKCYLAFNDQNLISAADGNPFRVMVSDGKDTHIFSGNFQDPVSSNAVTNVNGGSKEVTTKVSQDYQNNTVTTKNRLFLFEKGDKRPITVSIWLDSETATSNLFGSVAAANVNFIVGTPKCFYGINARTVSKAGAPMAKGFTGGSIKIGSTTYSAAQSKLGCVEGSSINLTAVPKEGYKFVGWYSDSSYKTLISEEETVSVTPSKDDSSVYYAKFEELEVYKTTIYVETRSGFSTYSIWAYQKFGTDIHHYSGSTWPGESATLDSTTGYYKYEFTTSDTGQFNIIISNNGGSQYPAKNKEGLVGDIGGTYIFTSDNRLVKAITVNAHTSTGGSATAGGKATVITREGKTIALKATPATGYKFAGWYKDAEFTTQIDTNYMVASQSITMTSGDAGKTLDYYAKFEKIRTLTLNLVTDGGGTATIDGKASPQVVEIGTTVRLAATPGTYYKFSGWYNDIDGKNILDSNYASASRDYVVTGTEDSTVTIYAKFIQLPVYTAKAIAVTNGSSGSSTGGTVQVNTAVAGANSTDSNIYEGNSAKFTATPKSGYAFKGWYTAASGGTLVSSNNPYTVQSMSANTTLYARFEAATTYTAKAVAVTNGTSSSSTGGTVQVNTATSGTTSSVTVTSGTSVTFKASPKKGYTFRGWYTAASGGTQESTDTSYTVSLTSAKTLYARFDRVVYLKPNSNWTQANARFAAYVWIPNSGEPKWYSMSDGDGDGIYSATIGTDYTMIIFCRMNPATTSNNWDNKWTKTIDITIPTDGKNLYTINSGSWDTGTWSTK